MLDDNRYLELIGLKVKLLRQRKRMSQQELADKVGYTNKGMISQVESGKVNITMDKLSKMAKALDIPIYELMKEDLSFLEGKGRPEGAIAFSPDPLAGLMTMTLSELKVPRNAEKKGKEILQPNEARRLMHDFEDEWYIYLWRFLLCTGMRPGEALGLKWSDIQNGTITIRRSINYRGRTTEGKNDNARRSFALNEILIGILKDQKERTWRLNSEYIFCNHAGKSSVQTGASKSWYRISRQMGANTSPYSLRHTFISFMAQALPEQALKSLVGHSVNMDTYGVYGHAVNGESQRTAEQVNITLVKKLQ